MTKHALDTLLDIHSLDEDGMKFLSLSSVIFTEETSTHCETHRSWKNLET